MAWPPAAPWRAVRHLLVPFAACFFVLLLGIRRLCRTVPRAANRRSASRHGPPARKQDGREAAIQPLEGFDWMAEEPRQFRPFKDVYHITMALQSNTPSELIAMDRDYLDRINLRRDLIRQHADKVIACLPGGAEAVRELYCFLVKSYLPTRFPTMFQLSGDGSQVRNVAADRALPTAPMADPAAALRVIGETVDEDMFLLNQTAEGQVPMAVVCCFPVGFIPSAKLGKRLGEVHAPVPSYDKVGPSIERFISKLGLGRSVKRLNWTVQTHGNLLVYDSQEVEAPAGGPSAVDLDQTFLRVELQTLSRLPQTRAVLFTFKTYLYPTRRIKDEGLGPKLATAIEGLKAGNAPDMWVYKGGVHWACKVCEYLRV